MQELRRLLLLLSASALAAALWACAQDDTPPLGDVARQARLQKQQKDAQAKEAQSKDTPAGELTSKNAQSENAQGKNTQGKDTDRSVATNDAPASKLRHVFTNDDIPEQIGPPLTETSGSPTPVLSYQQPAYGDKAPAEYWKSQIQELRGSIASLKTNIEKLSALMHAWRNCLSNCAQSNERLKEGQDQLDAMQVQLEQQQTRLEDTQEAARKQGYGNSVYDP